MNDIPFPRGKFASSLRKRLFREHLGLLDTKEEINIDDAVIRSFYRDVWCARSKRNTEIYEEVFQCVPTDTVVNFAILNHYQDKISLALSNPVLAQEMVEEIKVKFLLNIFICKHLILMISYYAYNSNEFFIGSLGQFTIEFFM